MEARLKSNNNEQIKDALQEICSFYRKGYRIRIDQILGIQNQIVGLAFLSKDAKVQRWTLNALAQLGKGIECKNAVLHCVRDHSNDPEIVAAGIAALYKISHSPTEDLKSLQFEPAMVALAALQHVPANNLDLSCLPLRVDVADSELLKLGTIVVGLNKAPPHLFEPNFSNAEMIKVVSRHHDPIVSQYSIWAVTENLSLTIDDVGFKPQEFEDRPENVRGWIYQLIGKSAPTANKLIDYVKHCIDDETNIVRSGLAEGLRETFSIRLEPIILEWFTRELDPDIRGYILDHFIRQSSKSDAYKSYALDAYVREETTQRDRERMRAAAPGTPMFSLYEQVGYNKNADFFRPQGVNIVSGNQINVNKVQGGAVSLTGTATNSGTVCNTLSESVNTQAQDYLSRAANEVKTIDAEPILKESTLKSISDAQAEPTNDRLSNAASALENFEKIAASTVGAATTLAPIIAGLAQLLGLS